MSKIKFCANLSFMFTEGKTILERYALARDAGFTAVETGFPFGHSLEEVQQAKRSSKVEQVLINLKTGDVSKGELGVTAQPGKEEEFRANLKQTIEYANALGAKKIHIMAGKVTNVTDDNWKTYEKNLQYAADVLKKANIVGVIEPINKYSVPYYFLADYDKAIEIIKRIDSPYIRLQLDVFHMQQICGDLSHNIARLMPHVGHVQIAQVPRRNEPDAPGEVNYRYILEEIAASGYSGWVGLEYSPAAATRDGLGWIREFGYTL